jgi:hypothetical protein
LKSHQPRLQAQAGSPGEPPSALRAQAAALVEELHAVHPQPGLPEKAIPQVERILGAAADPQATVDAIRRNHAAWAAHWEILRPGKFIPQLWRWFRDGEWSREVKKPVRHENFYERKEREYKESEHILKPLFEAEQRKWEEKQRRFRCG